MVIDLNNNVWAFRGNSEGQLGLREIIEIEIYRRKFQI